MSKQKVSAEKIKSKISQAVPQDAFGIEDSTEGTGRAARAGTKGLQGARTVPIDKILPDPDQPRRTFPEESLQELAGSIKEQGVLQPISVEYMPEERAYKIISGERRFHASKLAGLKEIPCIISEGVDSKKRRAHQLVENLQREDLNPVDKARAILEFKELAGSWEEVDKLTGLSPRRRRQYTALLSLPEDIQKEIVATGRKPAKDQITEKHARALLLLKKDPDKQQELFNLIKNQKSPLSGDKALDQAKEFTGAPKYKTFSVKYTTEDELIEKLEEEITRLRQALEQ